MRNRFYHSPLLIVIGAAFLASAWSGLLRLGWHLPVPYAGFTAVHGPLAVAALWGVLIILGDLDVSGLPWDIPSPRGIYSGLVLVSVGTVILMVGMNATTAFWLIATGHLALVLVFGVAAEARPTRQSVSAALAMLLGSIGYVLFLLDSGPHSAVPWWAASVILFIVGGKQRMPGLGLLAFVGVLGVGIIAAVIHPDAGIRLMGVGQIGIAMWLLRYDGAFGRMIHSTGFSRFTGVCLVSGYFWLMASGMFAGFYGGVTGGTHYDAMCHTLFLGFVAPIVFAHTLVILSHMLELKEVYHRAFYGHLALLHGALLLWVMSNLLLWEQGRRIGALLTVITMFVLPVTLVLVSLKLVGALRKSRAAYLAAGVSLPAFLVGLVLVIAGFTAGMDTLAVLQADVTPTLPPIVETAPERTPFVREYTPEMIASGEAAFTTHCSPCHGTDARGIRGLGKNLVDSVFVVEWDDTTFSAFIVAGRPVWDTDNTTGVAMPPRGGNPALSDEEINDIVVYIRSLVVATY